MATIGKNQFFEIKNGDGTSFHNLVLRKSAVESIVMSLGDKISGDVYYKDNTLSVTMHEYITYNGVNYMLINPPTIVREGVVSDNSELRGMTKYSFVFYHPMCQLSNFPFTDVAVTNDETRYLSESKTFSWIGKPADFVAKMNKNLDGTQWIVEISSRFPQDKLNELSDVIPFDNATIADACKTFYDTWGVPYVVDKVASTEASYATGKRFKLVMGLPSNEIYENAAAEQQQTPFVFQMGHGVGLKNNSRTPRNNKIITRISGYGSENNIPYGYPQVRWYGTAGQSFTYGDHAGVYTNVTIGGVHFDKVVSYPIYKGILNGEYVELIKHPFTRTHLMPSVYRTTLFNKISLYNDLGEVNTDYDPDITLVDYYDAIYSAQYPYPNTINLQAPSYESHEFEDEKPELGEAHIISATPLNNDLTPASSWDDSLDDEGNYNQSYFQMVLPQLSFDLYACASITEEMQINMRSGACLGCTFTVQIDWDDYKRNFYDEDGNFAPNGSQRDLTKYPKSNQGSISLVLQKDNSTFGTLMPNMYQYPKGKTSTGANDGDTFVVLGISLPESYILSAEEKLDGDMKSYMLENNEHYFDYPLKFDEDFLFHNENILSQIRPNTVVRFNYAGQTQALFVKQITIKYGEQQLPQYDITLTDNVEVVLNQIGQVAEDVEKLSTLIAILRQSYGKNVWNELAKKLSKTQDDTAAGYITMLKGLQVGANFVPDILGEGGVLRMRQDGKVELVTDILYARMKAYFDSVEIREYQHTGGNRIASVAGNRMCRVAWFNSSNVELEQTQANLASVAYFRCYFRASDGEDTVRNNWVIGDQAYCHITSVTTSSDKPEQKGLNQKHLWRLVIGRNTEGTLTEDGEAYIDLSNRATETISGNSYTGYQIGSDIPEAQDDIIQLGNVNDTTRQGAIVEFVTGTDAPSYQIYQGINSFSLNNKNQIGFGYNTGTGRAYLNVYGDAYIGARDRSTFIEYKQSGTGGNPELNIKAHVEFTNSNQELDTLVQEHQRDDSYDDTEVRGLINGLQEQIDGQVESWFFDYPPVHVDEHGAPDSKVPLNVAPYSDWTDDNAKIAHLGDTFTDNSSGYCWRFTRNENTNAFEWTPIEDSAIISALQNAARAQDTADHKRRVFLTQPVPPYDAGDMWANAVYPANYTGATDEAEHKYNNDILKCVTSKASDGSFSINDWTLASKYTDDSKFNGYIDAMLNGTGLSGDSAAATAQKAILSALGVGTVVAGGLLLSSLIGMRQYNGSGDKSDVSNYTTWAGISGQYNANVLGGGMAAWYGGGMVDKETLSEEQIGQGWDNLRWAKGVDRFDGSGYRADGNITWDEQGRVSIKDVTTIISSNNTDVLNELITFNNAFHFNLSQGTSTVLSIEPQAAFTNLYIRNTTNPNAPYHVATEDWVDDHYVSKTFFRQLFRAFKPNATAGQADVEVQPNTIDATISNIKAMVGFWTEQYVSALGNNSDGGGGGASVLYGLNDVTPNASGDGVMGAQDGYVLTYNGSTHHWYAAATAETYVLPQATSAALGGIKIGYAASGKNYAIVLDTNGKAYVNVPWTDNDTWIAWAGATENAAGTAGYMPAPTSAQRTQFLRGDGTWVSLNNYSLPLAASGVRGGVQIGYTTDAANRNYAVQLSSEKMYVNVPWTDTTYSVFGGSGSTAAAGLVPKPSTTAGTTKFLREDATWVVPDYPTNYIASDTSRTANTVLAAPNGQNGAATFRVLVAADIPDLSAIYATDGRADTLEGYFTNGVANKAEQLNTSRSLWGNSFNGTADIDGNITMSSANGTYIQIGDIRLVYDSTNVALKVVKSDGTTAANFYATGAISALGQGVDSGGGGGQGDVTWALLASSSDTRQIALSHLTTALAGYSTTSHTHTTTIAADSGTNQLTLAYGTKYKITAGGTSFVFTMPSADDTNTWRNIYVAGTQQITTAVNTKGLNFAAGNNVSLSFAAAGTGSGQSGNANYGTLTISATDTTYSAATQSAAGLMSAADKKKLDGIAANANNYSLPLAASGVRGGVQIGYTTDATNRNYAVQLSSEKMYVNVPWENTWRGIQNNLTSDSTTDSLSAAQGKALKGSITTLEGYFTSGIANQAACLRYGSSITTQEELDSYLDASKLKCCIWTDFTPTGLYGNGIVIAGSWANTSYGFQLAIDDDPTYKIHLRQRNGDGWAGWKQIPMGDGTGASGTWGISVTGNAATATKLQTPRTINGTSFDGSANITTANWGTARNISIADSDSTNTGSAVSVNGSAAVTLKLPSTIKATLSGNATTATTASKLSTVSKTAWGQTFWTSGGVPTSISGALSSVTNITMSGYIKIGDAYLSYDSTNNAIRVSANADGTGAVNFYAIGGVSALGQSEDGGGGGQGDVTWALLASSSDTRQIALSHLTTALGTYATQAWVTQNFNKYVLPAATSSALGGIKVGYTTSGKNYKVQLDSSNNAYVNVPWENTTYSAGTGISFSGTTINNSGVRATTINGNYLRVNTNGTNADLTIPYATIAGSTKKLASYYDSRPSTANLLLGDGSLRFFEATTSMTEGKPTIGDSSIIHLSWDTNAGWDKQIAVGHGGNTHMMIRAQNNGTWGSWINILDSDNSSVSKSGSTLTVKINGTSQSITDTNTWRGIQDNLTSSTNTTESLSAKQGYLLANGSARDNTKIPLYRYGGTGSTTKIKININSTASWMLCFVVTLYQGYRATKIMISGYQYGSNHWYQPEARLLGDSDGTETISVYFGYDSTNNLWVGFDGGSYTGVSINDVTNGYSQIDNFMNLFTISNVSSLATLQTTVTAASKANYANNADTTDGLHVHGGRNNEANKIVRTDGSGYIQCGWINTTSGNFTGTPDRIWASNDAYMRYMTPANFFPTLANDNSQLSVTVGGQNRKLTIAYATSAGNAATATKATNDSDGNAINSTYLKKSGGTMSGTLNMTCNTVEMNFRTGHNSYNSKMEYMTTGNEAMVWANQSAVTSFIFKCGLDLSNTSDWTGITPSLQIKNQSVYINSLIANGTSPSYNLYVNGSANATTLYENGNRVITTANIGSQSVNYATTAGSANSVAWANVSSRPTKLSQFTNDSGFVTSSGVTSVATGTGLTGGTITSSGTISINSTYQTYISHGESAYNSLVNYLPLSGGTLSGEVKIHKSTAVDTYFEAKNSNGSIELQVGSGGNRGVYNGTGGTGGAWVIATDGTNTWMSVGNVGIGTLSPSQKLHVVGNVYANNYVTPTTDGAYVEIGNIRLQFDQSNNAIKVVKSDGTAANFYATGGVSALGAGQESGGGDEYMKVTPNNAAHNANNIYDAGLYELSSGSSNLPFGAQYGVVLSLPYRKAYGNTSSDFSTQIALPNGDDSSYPNSMFYRTSLRSSWNAWQRVQNVSMSDVRLKTILSNPTFGIEQIANAPIIRYQWSKEGYGDKKVHIGSTAQYWMNVANEFVDKEFNGYYSLQYGVAALVSAITTARKVVDHEKRITELEKENKKLREEINRLKIA